MSAKTCESLKYAYNVRSQLLRFGCGWKYLDLEESRLSAEPQS